MKQQHPYCRTCGSHINAKDVCPHCGCEPLKGHNYCCDCGTSTIAEAIMCVHCGASLQKRFPAVLAILISIALAASVAVAGYFIIRDNNVASEQIAEAAEPIETADTKKITKNTKPLSRKKDEPVTIVNNIPDELLKGPDAISRIVSLLPEKIKEEKPTEKKAFTADRKKEETAPAEERPALPSKARMNVFSGGEMRSYGAACTYFEGRSKNNVIFFTTSVYGYVKINGKVYALQGIQKGNDIARFSGAGYEVTIEILGLAGNEKEWLAEATLVVTDMRHRTLSRHKIYSTCTDF